MKILEAYNLKKDNSPAATGCPGVLKMLKVYIAENAAACNLATRWQ